MYNFHTIISCHDSHFTYRYIYRVTWKKNMSKWFQDLRYSMFTFFPGKIPTGIGSFPEVPGEEPVVLDVLFVSLMFPQVSPGSTLFSSFLYHQLLPSFWYYGLHNFLLSHMHHHLVIWPSFYLCYLSFRCNTINCTSPLDQNQATFSSLWHHDHARYSIAAISLYLEYSWP